MMNQRLHLTISPMPNKIDWLIVVAPAALTQNNADEK
jgi:hypothetical protein